uniref:Serpentine receptor class gamma n=1 Tax=Caenorhabditis tropicalis TaxID=1561998 RepID=A0A1I7U1Y6_9PELO
MLIVPIRPPRAVLALRIPMCTPALISWLITTIFLIILGSINPLLSWLIKFLNYTWIQWTKMLSGHANRWIRLVPQLISQIVIQFNHQRLSLGKRHQFRILSVQRCLLYPDQRYAQFVQPRKHVAGGRTNQKWNAMLVTSTVKSTRKIGHRMFSGIEKIVD